MGNIIKYNSKLKNNYVFIYYIRIYYTKLVRNSKGRLFTFLLYIYIVENNTR